MMEKISVNLYGDGSKKALEAEIIHCDRADQCSFYQQGKCLQCRALFNPGCKFGRSEIVRGYTKRAAKFYEFRDRWMKDPLYNKFSIPKARVAVMGDHLFMATGLVYVRKRNESDEKWRRDVNGYLIMDPGFGTNYLFLPIEDATNELLKAIFSFHPSNLMGDNLTDRYRKDIVSDLLQDLKDCAPEIYQRFTAEFPEYIYEPNYIGKEVYVNSLKPGTRFTRNGKAWIYDGEYVCSEEEMYIGVYSPWCFQESSKSMISLKVNDKMTVKVESNDIIDENSRFM